MSNRQTVSGLLLLLLAVPLRAAPPKDLLPVTLKEAAKHAPIVLVADGQAKASIAVMGRRSAELNQAVAQLQDFVARATGAKLPIIYDKIQAPAIVIGACDLARQNGLDPAKMPIEGFAIKTIADHVLIVGRDEAIGPAHSEGTAYGVREFLERFVGVRWYYPGELGQSVPKTPILSIPPVWLEDAPVFRMRVMWPPMGNPWNGSGTALAPVQNFLRAGNSWPINLQVHQPDWSRIAEYKEKRPEVFQLRSDNTRDHFMLCYGNPRTLASYLENIERQATKKSPVHVSVIGDAITVSPNDAEIACYCPECRKLWNRDGGQYGSASRIVAGFTANLAVEVKKRWPEKTIIYLPYMNYTTAPEGVTFPGNVEVQLCGMPGLAQHKEPAIAWEEQANIDKWVKLTGRKIQNWHYSCWPEDRTKVVYQYPHVIRDFYQQNRDKTVGTFINGTGDHWPRQHISLYCWLKVLWNPDFNVDAAVDEYCQRMYGPAASTMRELVGLEMSGWENSRWPGGRMSPKGIHEFSFPRERVKQMQALLEKAHQQAAGDPLVLQRLDYLRVPMKEFFEESKRYHEGGGVRPLLIQKVGENPVIDGKLDDEVWKRAEPVPFVRGWDRKQSQPTYPTEVRAVWTADGVTFGFRMTEPTPELLERKIKGHDDSMAWWDDNIELFLDVTGKNEGGYYQFIINPNGAIADAKGRDFSWNAKGVKAQAFVGKDFWSLEVYIPNSTFPEALKPGTNTAWTGNFTRHRVADHGLKQTLKPRMGSEREYQRMNTTYAGPSNNLQDFAPLKFRE